MKGQLYRAITDNADLSQNKEFIGKVVIAIDDTTVPYVVFPKDYVEGWSSGHYLNRNIHVGLFSLIEKELEACKISTTPICRVYARNSEMALRLATLLNTTASLGGQILPLKDEGDDWAIDVYDYTPVEVQDEG